MFVVIIHAHTMKNILHLKYLSLLLIAVSVMFVVGCGRTSDSDPQPIMRLDRILASYDRLDQQLQAGLLDSVRPEVSAMFAVLGIDSVTPSVLDQWSRSRVVEVFQPAVDSVYPDLDDVSRQIGHIMEAARTQLPALPPMAFASVVWGNPRPVVRVDSVMLIALNHFLGADYPGYAQWPEYRRVDKTPAMLSYAVASALAASQYPMDAGMDATLLSWMLYEGALVEARMRLVPDAHLDAALGYTPDQLKYAEEHLSDIWQEMSVKRMIYDTDPLLIDRMVAPAPSSPVMLTQAPGRIGRYVGYRIVAAYLSKFPDTHLYQLLSKDFYADQQSLIKSGFSGR